MKNRKKTLIILCPELKSPGGISSVVRRIIPGLEDEYNVKVLNSRLSSGSRFRFLSFFKLSIDFWNSLEGDSIIYLHSAGGRSAIKDAFLVIISKLKRKNKARVVTHLHFPTVRNLQGYGYALIFRWLCRRSNAVITYSREVHVSISNSYLIPNPGIDSIFSPRKQIDLRKIIFLGEIGRRKGVDLLIDSLSSDLFCEEINVDLYGPISSAEFSTDRLVGLNYKYCGSVDPELVQDLLQKYDCLILPSRNEGLPVAVLEALSLGLVAIAPTNSSISDFSEIANACLLVDCSTESIIEQFSKITRGEIPGDDHRMKAAEFISPKVVTRKISCVLSK